MQTLHKNRTSLPNGHMVSRPPSIRGQTRAILGTMAAVIAGILLVAAGMMIAAG